MHLIFNYLGQTFLVGLLVFTPALFADLDADALFEYEAVELEQTRGGDEKLNQALDSSHGYVRLNEGFPLSLVNEGNVAPAAAVLNPARWNPDTGLDKLKTLVIQNLHLQVGAAKPNGDEIVVPFVSEVYFQQKHDTVKVLLVNVGEGVQGTIKYSGLLTLRRQGGEIAEVKTQVTNYDLSGKGESLAANLTEHINRYDGRFVKDVGESVLTSRLQQPDAKANLKKYLP